MVRVRVPIGLLFAALSMSPASAQSVADQRWHINNILTTRDTKLLEAMRAQCATGRAPAMIANGRTNFGMNSLPHAEQWCIATLTRAGRDGTLGYVRDPAHPGVTPAQAFDDGFVSGYKKHPDIPSYAPSMAALQPIAERCLGQHEPDTGLCNATGYAAGARAARGELPVSR